MPFVNANLVSLPGSASLKRKLHVYNTLLVELWNFLYIERTNMAFSIFLPYWLLLLPVTNVSTSYLHMSNDNST